MPFPFSKERATPPSNGSQPRPESSTCQAGQIVAMEGDAGSGMFVILDGTATVEWRGGSVALRGRDVLRRAHAARARRSTERPRASRDGDALSRRAARRRSRVGRVGALRRACDAEGSRPPPRLRASGRLARLAHRLAQARHYATPARGEDRHDRHWREDAGSADPPGSAVDVPGGRPAEEIRAHDDQGAPSRRTNAPSGNVE